MTGNDRDNAAQAGGDWARYWRSDQGTGSMGPIEAMHAHFRSHVYHRHSHETYSFGVTDDGAQAFTCRGAHHVSTANMVMLFNPDDPHDGHAATGPGFTYRMIHIEPGQVGALLGDAGIPGGWPLFPDPLVSDPLLARSLRRLHAVLTACDAAPESHEHSIPRHVPVPRQAPVLREPANSLTPRINESHSAICCHSSNTNP